MKIETWKKILIIAGTLTQVIAYFADSPALIITGAISIIVGTMAVFLLG